MFLSTYYTKNNDRCSGRGSSHNKWKSVSMTHVEFLSISVANITYVGVVAQGRCGSSLGGVVAQWLGGVVAQWGRCGSSMLGGVAAQW